jgi:hypothetical protein
VTLKHRDFRRHVHTVLQTDARGRVELGALKGVQWVRLAGPENTTRVWHLHDDRHTGRSAIHGRVGEALVVPYMGRHNEPDRAAFSLLEARAGTFVKDWRSAIAVGSGLLTIKGLPAGEYSLWLKEAGRQITIRVADGDVAHGHVLAKTQLLQRRNTRPLQIASVSADKDTVTVRLRNADDFSRVHVVATRFVPAYESYASLARWSSPSPASVWMSPSESLYLSGRDIGDEYRYILERKYARKFPGNLLRRPSLLLNPWAVRKTETGLQEAQKGMDWAGSGSRGGRRRDSRPPARAPMQQERLHNASSTLDFLAEPALLMANLRPKNGVVVINRKDLGAHQDIHVVAVDPLNVAARRVALDELVARFNNLRLAKGLDPKKHYTEQKQITVVPAGETLTIADLGTSKVEVYDTLARVYGLYVTLSREPKLAEFAFVLQWPTLKPEQKREKYSKYACHELSFFIQQKDPDFFKAIVLPYLKNKKDKTYLDHWLIGSDLTPYTKPWSFRRLNVAERALLGRRLAKRHGSVARPVRELWELIPPNIERDNYLFRTALKGRALEAADEKLGIRTVRFDEIRGPRHALLSEGNRRQYTKDDELPSTAPKPPPAPEKRPAEESERTKSKAGEREAKDLGRDRAGKKSQSEGSYYERDGKRRRFVRQLYRKLDKTQEWAESNYYHLTIHQQNAGLVTANTFWRDYAAHDGRTPFFSPHFAKATKNFSEMMLALAVLDLPFEAKKHETAMDGRTLTLKAASPLIAFHKEIKPAKPAGEKTPILVSQNFFRQGDRYRHVNNERVDKFVTDEFLVHTVYGCQVVVTNPTSSRQKLDVLLQIPVGALPVLSGFYTRSVHINLGPYSTQRFEYHFYFPAAGQYAHFPVHTSKNEQLIAHAPAVTLTVVEKPSKIDKTSWDYVSQFGSDKEVLDYLRTHNLERTDLGRIAFRMHDAGAYARVLDLLRARHAYHHTLWSYAIKHNDTAAARQYLQHSPYAARVGAAIDSKLLTVDPVERKTYEHLEYRPLVNARAHQLGKRRHILNDRFHAQYTRLLKILSYRRQLDDEDRMAVTYYLLLQDRVADALSFFRAVDPARLATRLQYDYFRCYLDLYTEDHRVARRVAEKYKDYGVDRWRTRFAEVIAQLDEIEGKGVKVVDSEDRTQAQTGLADTEPSLDFTVEAKRVVLTYQNLETVTVRYYLMDVELLFSRQPFMQKYAGQFSYIQPNHVQEVRLPAKKTAAAFDLPDRFHNRNVMVEITGRGVKKSEAYYSNALALRLIETYGQLKVADARTGRPLPKVYVKVYARMKNGRTRFYKDGYTDLRGRFDYTSLNTNELDHVQRFSILILSETAGAVIREAAPPKR